MNHLSLLRENRKRAGVHFRRALFVVLTLLGIIIAQILISVATASGAYEIAALKAEAKQLQQEASSLSQSNDVYASPQFLATQAEKLGMVSGGSPAFLRLSDGSVIGSPNAASAEGQMALYAPIPNALLDKIVSQEGYPVDSLQKEKPVAETKPTKTDTKIPQTLTNGIPAISTH